MALTPNSPEAFVREVDEELRRDRMETLWRRHGLKLVAALVIALALLAGFLWWQQHRRHKAGVAGEALSQALASLSEGREAAARAGLAPLATATPTYAALAHMAEASIASGKKDDKGAAAAFARIAGDTTVPQPIRDVATLRAAALDFDRVPPAETIARLKDLAVAGNPFFGSAGEMTVLANLRMGRRAEARGLIRMMVADRDLPESIRDRIGRLATVIDLAPAAPSAPAQPKP